MNAIPPADLEAFAAALRAERPQLDQVIDIAVCMAQAAMTFAGRCIELQRMLDAVSDPERISGGEIIARVARDHGVTVRDIKSASRRTDIVNARRDACVHLRDASFSNSQICRLLNRDHTSVTYALKRASGLSAREIREAWTSARRKGHGEANP